MKIADKLDKVLIYIGMICLFSIMVVIALDGLGRHFFDSPITGAYVLVEKYLMVAMIFPAIGYTWAKRGHISLTLVLTKMPAAVQNIVHLITLLCGLAIFGLIAYTGFDSTFEAYTRNQVTSGLIRWPLWLAYIWMFLGAAVFCVRLLLELATGLATIIKQGIGGVILNPDVHSHESAD